MTPELVFPFPAHYELVFHERIPRELGLLTLELPAAVAPDPQQELAQAPIVEVCPAVGEPWVGILFTNVAPNVRGTVIGWPDEESFCFFGGGGAYVVHSGDPRRVTPRRGPLHRALPRRGAPRADCVRRLVKPDRLRSRGTPLAVGAALR